MKKTILFIVISLSCLQLYSQSITVELSNRWNKEKDPLSLNGDSICIPYLDIIYRNNSDKALYFLKISQSDNGLPRVARSGATLRGFIDPYELMKYVDYSNLEYSISLMASLFYKGYWEIMPDTIDINEEHEIDLINDELSDIYKYLFYKYFGPPDYKKWDFLISDITPEKILNEISDNFVFLKPGEIYTDTYNLIAFKLIKGSYTFNVYSNSLIGYVYGPSVWSDNQSRNIQEEIALPLVVGEYELYADSLNTNSITITF